MAEDSQVPDDAPFQTEEKLKHGASEAQSDSTVRSAPQLPFFAKLDRMTSSVMSALGWTSGKLSGTTEGVNELTRLLKDKIKVPTGLETFDQVKKRLGASPNREENLNPLGLDTIAKSILDEISRVKSLSRGADNASAAADLASAIDLLRSDIYDLNTIGITIRNRWTGISVEVYEDLEPGNTVHSALINFMVKLETYLVDPGFIDVSASPDIESQLYLYRSFFLSLGRAIANARDAGFDSSDFVDDELTDIIQLCVDFVAKVDEIISKHNAVSHCVTERVETIDPQLGPFVSRGLFQQFDTDSYAAGRSRTLDSVLSSPMFRSFRKSYLSKGLSSVPKMATDYGNKGGSERDTVDAAHQQVKSMPTAAPYPGAGDKIQADKSVESQPDADYNKGPVGPLDESNWSKYKQTLGQRESGNDYSRVNTIGFVGKWQFGAAALVDLGYVKPGSSTRGLVNDSAWTGKDGISSRKDFLDNKGNVQDKAIFYYTKRNYKGLLNSGVVSASDSPDEQGGYMAAAHLKGVGGAREFKNGRDNRDAYGTAASSYYNMMKSALNGSAPSGEASQVAKSLGADKAGQTRAFVDAGTLSDSPQASFPVSSAAAPKNAYNKVRTYEGGHFKEYDGTPGAERIQERHRTGTGYEIDASGVMKTLVTKDNYTAVLGNNTIMVQGACHITALGDVTIRSGGKTVIQAVGGLDLNVGGDLNVNVSGNRREIIEGSDFKIVKGDQAEQIEGFKKVGVTGDSQHESASVAVIARDSQINLSAKTDINAAAIGKAHLSGKAKTMVTSAGNVVTSAGGNVSTSGSTVETKASAFEVKADSTKVSGSTISLKAGSNIEVSPKVSHADYAERSQIAAILDAVVKPPNNAGDASFGAEAETSSRVSEMKKEDYDKKVTSFDPIKGKTQAYGGGQESGSYDGKGYSKGVTDGNSTVDI